MIDFSLYLVTDRTLSLDRTTVEIMRAAAVSSIINAPAPPARHQI